ncbi:hypothetical protein PMNALOAF_2905 [Methylobacterium adhaesivum]|uniref:VrrB protein n=1 Tax=Methylobacterium adhaesivum TaxID=333297 RepID=A0ABT8BCA7_9HYPH|nr:hypothetical protein [Methylobacterium adhaesivum]MDN3588986.1 hypothetical protein [Methylobacterium adhaesivum]GJD31645.1 hypothetical protein PMNALOAF_2905 [Methylobacterium adhaesivum]
MRTTPRSGLVRSLAIVLAMIGAMFVAAPQGAQAAPAMVSTQVAGPADALTQVQYGGWRHHHGHHHRHFGHRRHFGHHYGHRRHHFGRHFGHHRHHHHGYGYGRRHFY